MSRWRADRRLRSLIAALAVVVGLGVLPAAAAAAAVSTGSLSVLAVDSSGLPVPGSRLSLINQTAFGILSGTTGADGVATFPSAGGATWNLFVTPPAARANELVGGAWISDAALLSGAGIPAPIVVGDVVRAVTARLSTAGSVAGTVTARDGTPAAGAQVFALAPGVTSVDLALGAVADATGHYVLGAMPAGPYTLFAGPGSPTQGAPEFWENAATMAQATSVTVVGGAQLDRSFALTSGLSVSGTLTANQLPAGGVVITIVQDGGFVSGAATTAADGTFQVNDLLPGQYSIAFTFPGNPLTDCWRAGAAPVATDPCGALTVVGDQTGLDLVALASGQAGGGPTGGATGTTTTLSLDTPTLTFGTAGALTVRVGSTAGASGAVTVTEAGQVVASGAVTSGVAALSLPATLAAGSHTLVAHFAGGAAALPSDSAPLDVVVGRALPTVTLRPGGALVVGQAQGLAVEVGAVAGHVAAGTVDLATSGGTPLGTVTLASGLGTLALVSPLPAGLTTVVGTYSGDLDLLGAQGTTAIPVAKGAPVVTLALPASAATGAPATAQLSARLPDGAGGSASLAGAAVTVTLQHAGTGATRTIPGGSTGADGTLSLTLPSDLAGGTWTMTASIAETSETFGASSAAVQLAVSAGVRSATTISLRPTTIRSGERATAVVKVTAGGGPASGMVELRVGTRILPGVALIRGIAGVRLPRNLAPGTYAVVAAYAGTPTVQPSTATTTLTVTAPHTHHHNLRR